MTGFQELTAKAAPLDSANVDTDQIIPKQFLTAVTRTGFGKHLFNDWRYLDNDGKQDNPDFVLNHPQYQGAQILLSRENFGCGSSREHAPWALLDYGFKVIIATSFADIFYGNCMNNQLLPIALPNEQMDVLFDACKSQSHSIEIDLEAQTVICAEHEFKFDINPFHKHCLLEGLDSIGLTLQHLDNIEAFEKDIPQWRR